MSDLRGWAKFGVRGLPVAECETVTTLANDFKAELAALHLKRHRQQIDLRNECFPRLFEACVAYQAAYARFAMLDKMVREQNTRIGYVKKCKRDASKARENLGCFADLAADASTEQKSRVDARNDYKADTVDRLYVERKAEFARYYARIKAIAEGRRKVAESLKAAGIGPNNKQRKQAAWPTYPGESFEGRYLAIEAAFDNEAKSLNKSYQTRGLHSDVRAEIGKAVGELDFTYNGHSDLRAYDSFPVQFKNGAECPTLSDLSEGCQGLLITYLGSGRGRRMDCHLYRVRQQIGNSASPCIIEYEINMHRPIPDNARLKRWTLRLNDGHPYVTTIIDTQHISVPPQAEGVVTCDYSFGRERADRGMNVCYFLGDAINEEVYLPAWLVDKFDSVRQIDTTIDASAEQLLAALGQPTKGNKLTAIRRLAETHAEAATWLAWRDREWSYRNKIYRQAIRARDNIYLTAVARIAKLHSHLIEDPMRIAEGKRKATRDAANPDTLPAEVRRRAQIVAPGTLRKYLRASRLVQDVKIQTNDTSRICQKCRHLNEGKPSKVLKCEKCGSGWDRDFGACLEHLARAGVDTEKYAAARKTDVVTSYIASLGVKTGPVPCVHQHPSWTQQPVLILQRLRETG